MAEPTSLSVRSRETTTLYCRGQPELNIACKTRSSNFCAVSLAVKVIQIFVTMNVLITAATEFEILTLNDRLKTLAIPPNKLEVNTLITGIGGVATTYSLVKALEQNRPDFSIQMGIAGSFDRDLAPGSVVYVKEELMGDMGAEENNEFRDLFDLALLKKDAFPFEGRMLRNPSSFNADSGLKAVRSIGINEITTRQERIELLQRKYHPVVESMEGAAFHYVCLQEKIPFLQIRAVSNYVGERDKKKWNIQLAIANLTDAVFEILPKLPLF